MGAAWTDEELLSALQAVAEDVDGPLTSFAYNRLRAPGLPSTGAVVGHYGTWAAALAAAGLPPTGHRWRRWTEDEALEAIAAWLAATDDHRYLTYVEAAKADASLPSVHYIDTRLGGWKLARAAARGR